MGVIEAIVLLGIIHFRFLLDLLVAEN